MCGIKGAATTNAPTAGQGKTVFKLYSRKNNSSWNTAKDYKAYAGTATDKAAVTGVNFANWVNTTEE